MSALVFTFAALSLVKLFCANISNEDTYFSQPIKRTDYAFSSVFPPFAVATQLHAFASSPDWLIVLSGNWSEIFLWNFWFYNVIENLSLYDTNLKARKLHIFLC